MTDDRKNIVLNTDSQYVVHCCTMLTSLFENNKNCKFNINSNINDNRNIWSGIIYAKSKRKTKCMVEQMDQRYLLYIMAKDIC